MTINLDKLFFDEKLKLAQSKNTPSEVLAELSLENYHQILSLIASNPNTPLAVIEAMGEQYADEIISNPVFELLLLENPNSQFLKLCLASSSNTPIEILEKLSCDRDYTIRAKVAENNNIANNLLKKLAEDQSYHVIKSVLKNNNVSEDVLKTLTSNLIANNYFSHKIIKHSKFSTDILYLLIKNINSNH